MRNIQDSASGVYRTDGGSKPLCSTPPDKGQNAVIYLFIGRCESRTRYFRDGKLIVGAAKLIDLDNNIKIFRG